MKYLFQAILFTGVVLGVASFGVAQELVEHSTFSSTAKIITYDKDKWELQIDTQNCSESLSDKDIIAALLGAKKQHESVSCLQIKGKFANKQILQFMDSFLAKPWLCNLKSLNLTAVNLDNECMEYLAKILKNLENLTSFRVIGNYVTQSQNLNSGLDEFGSELYSLHKRFLVKFECELTQTGNVTRLVQKKLDRYINYANELSLFSSPACLQDLQGHLES
jgi:hypothetical protein